MDGLSVKVKRTLATDLRYSQIDLANDQVWELLTAGGEPPAITVQTTYGLRCTGIKVFPRFTCQGTTLTDPQTFFQPLQLQKRFTNYAMVTCSPFSSIDVELEFWVPSSNSICGRTRFFNSGKAPVTFNCEWAVLLQPHERGESMSSAEMGINLVLRGMTEDLFPVFFLTGGPQLSAKAYPALALDMTLAAKTDRRVSWSLATLDSYEASFTLARQNTALPWDTELVKHEMEEKRKTFHFSSANRLLNDLLLETQIVARQCLIKGPAPLQRLTLLSKRQPDSPLGDFAISARTRQGNLPSTAYDLWQLSRILLPVEPGLFKELMLGFIDNQQINGAIPWTIQPSGTASKALTPPLLAGIAWDVHAYLQESAWLTQIYTPLLGAFRYWFTSARTEGTPGWPVWDHLLQTGLDQAPQYSIWHQQDQGVDLRYIDSPALGAMLYHECQALIQIGQWLDKKDDLSWLQARGEEIKEHVSASLNEQKGTYQYRDAKNGCVLPSADLYQAKSNGSFRAKLDCGGERRLVAWCITNTGFSSIAEVTLTGKNSAGAVEEVIHFSPGQFQDGIARVTSGQLFSNIDQIQITGLQKTDIIKLVLAGFDEEDITLLLPLWAGIPSHEQAQKLVEDTLLPRYLSEFGLTSLPVGRYPDRAISVIPFWNTIMIEGLLNYGMRPTAAKVMQAYLDGLTTQWQMNGLLNDGLRSTDAQGIGGRDCLSALPGLLPFLRTLGIDHITPKEIIFNGLNEFFSPFLVQYGQTNLQMDAKSTIISMLNGTKSEIRESGMQKIVLP